MTEHFFFGPASGAQLPTAVSIVVSSPASLSTPLASMTTSRTWYVDVGNLPSTTDSFVEPSLTTIISAVSHSFGY